MSRISDDGLIKITNLNLDFAPGVSDRTKIAHMAIAANPNLRPLWEARRVPLFRATRNSEPYCPARKHAEIGPSCCCECFPSETRVGRDRRHSVYFSRLFFSPGIGVGQLERVASRPPLLSLSATLPP